MQHKNWTKIASILSAALVVLGTTLFTGCSSEAPIASQEPATTYSGQDAPFAHAEGVSGSAGQGLSSGDTWYQVASVELDDAGGVVSGGRWTLTVPGDAWDESAYGDSVTFSFDERDPGLLDMQLTPEGLVFDNAATLTVEYSGTNVDSDSANFDGSVPGFFVYNPDTDSWDAVPGTDDAAAKTYTISLSEIPSGDDDGSGASSSSGFSFWGRYALFGTPGW